MCHRREHAIKEEQEMGLRVLKEMAEFKAKPRQNIANEESATLRGKGHHAHGLEMKSCQLRQKSETGLQMGIRDKFQVRAPKATKGGILRNSVKEEQRRGVPTSAKPSPKSIRRMLERKQRQWEARLKATRKPHKPVIAPKQLPLEKREEAYCKKMDTRSKARALKEREQARKEVEAIKRERERKP